MHSVTTRHETSTTKEGVAGDQKATATRHPETRVGLHHRRSGSSSSILHPSRLPRPGPARGDLRVTARAALCAGVWGLPRGPPRCRRGCEAGALPSASQSRTCGACASASAPAARPSVPALPSLTRVAGSGRAGGGARSQFSCGEQLASRVRESEPLSWR